MNQSSLMFSRGILGRRDGRTMVAWRLSRLAPMGAEQVEMILNLEGPHLHRPLSEMVAERAQGVRPKFIVSGWAARTRNLPDGRRQILSLLLPGDAVGLSLRPHPLAIGSTTALTSVQCVDASPLQAAIRTDEPRWAGLRQALHASDSLHEIYLMDQVTRLGRLTAYERMCHLLLELRDRLALVGLGDAKRFPMPLTQEVLADATGLSVVHVNRVLQQLRRERMLDLRSGVVSLLEPEAMIAASDYASPDAARWSAPPPA